MAKALPKSVRAKLLTAIAAMLALMLGSAILAIGGLSRTDEALSSLSDERMPDIIAATELARQTTALAALAPFVSALEVMNQLETEATRINQLIANLDQLVTGLPQSSAFTGQSGQKVRLLAQSLCASVEELLLASRKGLELRAELVELQYGFDRQAQAKTLLAQENSPIPQQLFSDAVGLILMARVSASPLQLDQLEADYHAKAQALADYTLSPKIGWIERLLEQQASLFALRRDELQLQQRIQYLLASIHSLSMDMSEAVKGIVHTTSTAAEAQSHALSKTVQSTQRSIGILGAIALGAAALTALYVLTDLARNLDAVTQAMSRLASGDRSADIPGLKRSDELGSLARAFAVFKDASLERERLAEQVIEGNRLVEAMFSNMSDGISVFDQDRRLISWNPQFLAMTGLTAEGEYHAMSFEDLTAAMTNAGVSIHELDGRKVEFATTISQRVSKPATYELHHANGKVVEIRSQPMPEGGFVTVYMDQTDRRDIEKRLRQAQRMEAVGQLTGGIAHDFNNFLASISGNLQMLQEELYDDPKLSARILRALDASERAAGVTERLLAFARQQALELELTRVDELMFNLLELLGQRLAPTVEIRANIESDLPPLVVDPGRLESAVLNLLFNGRDAMPEGGTVTLDVSCARDAGYVSLKVSDTGVGMSPEVLARIYEPFFTTKGNGRGSGLGLSMVYGFITQSGGEILVESELGQGTTVEIRLPLPQEGAAPIPEPEKPLLAEIGAGELILLVEDDPIVRDTTSDMLLSLGYRVYAVGDLAGARTALKQRQFDLVFTDFLLPEGMTGLDVAQLVKNEQPATPLLFASGYTQTTEDQPLRLPEGASLLRKPYRKTDLAHEIAAQLQKTGQRKSET